MKVADSKQIIRFRKQKHKLQIEYQIEKSNISDQ